MMKKQEGLLNRLSSVVMAVAVTGAGTRSLLNFHEPKVPAKLRKEEE